MRLLTVLGPYDLLKNEMLWLLRDQRGLMCPLAVLGVYDLLMNKLLWRTAGPRSHGELLWLLQDLRSVMGETSGVHVGPDLIENVLLHSAAKGPRLHRRCLICHSSA